MLPPVRNDYRILLEQPTSGLFPASMAVSRVAMDDRIAPHHVGRPRLLTDPRNEFLRWNRAFDNLMALSEVFPIAERTLGGGAAEPEQILAAYRALDARLGFVYAVNELSETETEIMGVMYETKTLQPIACMHAHAGSTLPPDEATKKNETPNLWETDSRALVRERMEKLVHACLRQLILGDQPAGLEDRGGWKHLPVRPAEWPPRDFPPPTELQGR
jgi:hypothetical protein